ncbi:DUF551 domain-containing protein [Providencia hangzhouensis]|uniref:DUF551 domain-containing protein n=1 Tax=Providencia TaxID=586 RepID=UPI00109D64F5|nr:DUF551 domain-containing protein [Providencia sp. MGF014]THB27364.1 hypothetical protein E6R27_08975 [Providencia sp. MGF014]
MSHTMKPIVYAFRENGNIVIPNEPPFDGESVLLKTCDGIVEGWWNPDSGGSYEDPNDVDGFCWVILNGKEELELDNATHWMPLPTVEEVVECEPIIIEEKQNVQNDGFMPELERLDIINNFVSGIPTEQMAGLTLEQWIEKHTTHDLVSSIQSMIGDTPNALDVNKVFEIMKLTPVPSLMASLLSAQFICTGAANYLEQTFESNILGKVVVIAQRKDGLTPCEKLEAAEKEIENLKLVLGNKINNEI